MEKNQSVLNQNWVEFDLVELTQMEAVSINGGESLWYWVGYGIGWFNNAASPGAGEYDRIRRETGFGK